MYSGSWCAPATSTRRSTSTGGMAAPEPSKRVTPVSRVFAPDLQLVTLDHLRARRSPAAHRDYAGVEPLPREQPRQIPRDRRLADPLTCPDERKRSYPHPLPVTDHGLIREIHDHVDGVLTEGFLDRRCRVLAGYEGHTV